MIMAFADTLSEWADQALKQRADCTDEFKVRNGLVEPFIHNVLGFNVFNVKEVVPEHLCAFGPGKTDRVDYATFLDGKLVMIIECKGGVDATLNKKHVAQLKQYYAACETKGLVGVLTNGIQWQFFADPTMPCQMHTDPFLVFHADNLGKTEDIELLEKITKPKFDLPAINTVIRRRQIIEGMKAKLGEWLATPPDYLVRLMGRGFVDGKIGKIMLEEYRGYLNAAIRRFLDDYIEKRLPTTGQAKAIPQDEGARMRIDSAAITGATLAGQTAHVERGTLSDDFVEEHALDEQTEQVKSITENSQGGEGEESKPQRSIKAADLVKDIRSGMSFGDMSGKYGISAAKLSQFLHHLVYKGMLSNADLPEQTL